MRNFVRALRHAWPYRSRLAASVVCALLAAVLWGMNFTSIYPVLKLLHSEISPHQWIDGCIASVQRDIDSLQQKIAALEAEADELERLPGNRQVDQMKRDLSLKLARFASKLEQARTRDARYQLARRYVYMLPADPFRTLAVVVALVVLVVAIKCFFEFAQESLVGSVVNRSLYDLRNRFYRNVIHLDVEQFSDKGTGELMARFTNDMESLGAGLKTLFGKVVAEPLRALSCVLIACWISWQLTLMFLVIVPVAGFVLSKVGRLMKKATRRVLERMSSIYKILQESFQGIRVVKAFTMEPYERRRFCSATKDYCDKSQRVVNLDALTSPIIELLGVVTVAGALLVGSYLVLGKHTDLFGLRMTSQPLEAETLLQLYVLLAAVADPVRKLSSVFTRIQSACAASDRIYEYLDRQPRVRTNSDGHRLERCVLPDQPVPVSGGAASASASSETVPATVRSGNATPRRAYVEFRNACFSYDPTGKPILDQVSFTVQAGENIALVGPNGCGKTTLLGLIPRFYDPNHGSVLIDGHDLRTVHLRSLRQQIGLVTQEPILFADTIYNNIAYGARGATREEVEEAARRACAHDFISKLEDGYEHVLGEAGRGVSGGEKQRLALARAILRDPSILILDEFTSNADSMIDVQIHEALSEFCKGRTTFIITHRMHTLKIADRILVMDQGRIIAMGTDPELRSTCSLYARLQEAQSQRLCA